MILIVIVSIFVLTGAMWIANKFIFPRLGSKLEVCPICAGVSGTWIWLLVVKFIDFLDINPMIPAILLGGSVVGIAYQIEKKLPKEQSSLLWKVVFIPLGFLAVYNLILFRWYMFLALVAVLVVIAMVFLSSPKHKKDTPENKKIEEIEKGMENCC